MIKINPKKQKTTIEGIKTVQKSNKLVIPQSPTRYELLIIHKAFSWFGLRVKKKLEILKPSKKRPKFGEKVVSTKESEYIHCKMQTKLSEVALRLFKNAKTQKIKAPIHIL